MRNRDHADRHSSLLLWSQFPLLTRTLPRAPDRGSCVCWQQGSERRMRCIIRGDSEVIVNNQENLRREEGKNTTQIAVDNKIMVCHSQKSLCLRGDVTHPSVLRWWYRPWQGMTAMTQICKVPVKCKWEKIRVKVKGIKVKARYRCAGSDLCLCVSFIVLLIREEFFLFLVRIAMRYEVFKRHWEKTKPHLGNK